jgi:hypothetical protein
MLLIFSLFVSLVYCVKSTVRWFVVREKHCWMTADCADKFKRTEPVRDDVACPMPEDLNLALLFGPL